MEKNQPHPSLRHRGGSPVSPLPPRLLREAGARGEAAKWLLFSSRSIPEPLCCLAQPYHSPLGVHHLWSKAPARLGHCAQRQPQLLRSQRIHLTGFLGPADCCAWRIVGGAGRWRIDSKIGSKSRSGMRPGLGSLSGRDSLRPPWGAGGGGLPQGSPWPCQARPTRQSFCAGSGWRGLRKA